MPLTEGCRRSRPLRGLKAQRRQPPCAGGGQPRCTERERRCTKRERMYRERGRRCTQVQVLYICIVCMYHVYVYRDFICLLNGTAAASPHWSRALRCRKMLRSLAGGGGGAGVSSPLTSLPSPSLHRVLFPVPSLLGSYERRRASWLWPTRVSRVPAGERERQRGRIRASKRRRGESCERDQASEYSQYCRESLYTPYTV